MSQPEYNKRNLRSNYDEEINLIKSLLRQVRNIQSDRTYRLVEHSNHTFTHADIEWIINRLGYRPTRDMWKEAGVKFVDRSFVGPGPDWLDQT